MMVPIWWSVLLTVVGVSGLWLAGRNNKWGWAVGIAAQGLWIAYAVATNQWGFLGSAGAYGFVYVRNFARWHQARQREMTQSGEPESGVVAAQLLGVEEQVQKLVNR